jgi:hypothetical protein
MQNRSGSGLSERKRRTGLTRQSQQTEIAPTKATKKRREKYGLVGRHIICPGDVFSTPGQDYSGTITSCSKDKGETKVYVKFTDDKTYYWFPEDKIVKWLVDPQTSSSQVRKPVALSSFPPCIGHEMSSWFCKCSFSFEMNTSFL